MPDVATFERTSTTLREAKDGIDTVCALNHRLADVLRTLGDPELDRRIDAIIRRQDLR